MRLLLPMMAFMFTAALSCRSTNPESETRTIHNLARSGSTDFQLNQCRGTNTEQHEKWMQQWFYDPTQNQSSANGDTNPPRSQPSTNPTEQLPLIEVRADRTGNAQVDQQNDDLLRQTLKDALTAVPLNLQVAFFGIKNRIIVDEHSNAVCKNAFKAQGLQPHAVIFQMERRLTQGERENPNFAEDPNIAVHSCWIYNQNAKRLEIRINNDITVVDGKPRAISVEHGTVRMFAFVLSQVIANLDLDDAGSNNPSANYDMDVRGLKFKENKQFSEALTQMAANVKSDIQYSNGKYDLNLYKEMFNEKGEVLNDFRYYLFADSFDSYYCNQETRAAFYQNFDKDVKQKRALVAGKEAPPTSFETFTTIAKQLEDLSYNGSPEGQGDTGVQTGYKSTPSEIMLAGLGIPAGLLAPKAPTRTISGTKVAFLFRWASGVFRGMFNITYNVVRFAYNATRYAVNTAVNAGRVLVHSAVHIVNGAFRAVVNSAAWVTNLTLHAGYHIANAFVRGAGYITAGVINTVRHVVFGPRYYPIFVTQ